MEYDWTSSGYDATVAQGDTAEEVHFVLTRAKKRVRRHEGDDHVRILGQAHSGRLVEVWLREETDDYWLVVIAYEAGLAGQALFRRLFRE